jgi:hypothetical protein
LADLRTNIETMKVNLTTNIVWLTVLSLIGLIGLDWFTKDVPKDTSKVGINDLKINHSTK